jgi:hypothetical protein
VVRGSCLCGGVQFELTEEPGRLTHCHCATCKRLSGGVGTVNVGVPSAAVRIVEGQDLLRTFQPAEGSAKTFCSTCGTNLFGAGWPASERASVRVPNLQDFEPKPGIHIFVRSTAPWETLPDDGLERHDVRPGEV